MDTHRCVAFDLPGFGASELPPEQVSIRGYGRWSTRCATGSGIDRPVMVGNSMGGFVGAELAIAFPTRVARSCWSRPPGSRPSTSGASRCSPVARLWAALTARAGAQRDTVVRRPRLRRVALQALVRYPERLSVPLTEELVHGAGKPGFLPRFDALLELLVPRPARRIEIPVLIVWGRNDMLVPVADADGSSTSSAPTPAR